MKSNCIRTTLFLVVGPVLWVQSPADAQQASAGPARREQLLYVLRPICEKLTLQITTQRELSLALSVRPVDTASVCNCAESSFSTDPRLAKFWALSEKDMSEPIQSEQVKSYMTGRIITSILECLANELNMPLGSTALPRLRRALRSSRQPLACRCLQLNSNVQQLLCRKLIISKGPLGTVSQ